MVTSKELQAIDVVLHGINVLSKNSKLVDADIQIGDVTLIDTNGVVLCTMSIKDTGGDDLEFVLTSIQMG